MSAAAPTYNPDQVSIWHAFQRAPEVSNFDCTSAPSTLEASGDSTARTDAPGYWRPRAVTHYLTKADTILNDPLLKPTLVALKAPIGEPGPCLTNATSEADVVRVTDIYLVHLVLAVMNVKYGGVCRVEAEVTTNSDPSVHRPQIDTNHPKIRTDLQFTAGPSNHAFSIIEFKNRPYVSHNATEEQFNKGRAATDAKVAEFEHEFDALAARRTTRPRGSKLEGNALMLSKQAASYANGRATTHVALCDWDAFFFFDFCQRGFPAGDVTGRWAYGTYLKDKSLYRRALLGFVAEGFEQRFHGRIPTSAMRALSLTSTSHGSAPASGSGHHTPSHGSTHTVAAPAPTSSSSSSSHHTTTGTTHGTTAPARGRSHSPPKVDGKPPKASRKG